MKLSPDNTIQSKTRLALSNDLGYKKLPIIGYRNDLRAGGDGELGFNAMFLPPILETGGIEVRGNRAELVLAIGEIASKL